MIKLENKAAKENPFYGMIAMLDMFQQVPKMSTNPSKTSVQSYLKNAYAECKTDEQKQLFYVLVFSFGDISNREHNFFKKVGMKKVDAGGNSMRKVFLYAMEWMLTFNKETEAQFYKFLPILSEYTNFENLFFYQLRTDRFKGKVTEVIKLPVDIDKVTTYLAQVISDAKTPDITHGLIAKFLPRASSIAPRVRTKTVPAGIKEFKSKKLDIIVKPGDTFKVKTKIQKETVEREKFKFQLLKSLSEKLGWAYQAYAHNVRFLGVEAYKAKYNRLTEAYLFSSKDILNWDKDQFINWLNILPSGARFRVQRRVLDKDKNVKNKFVPNKKWINKFGDDLGQLFLTWEKGKVVAQEVLLNLTEDDKKNMTSKELKQIQKAAKVTTGSENLINVLAKLKQGSLTNEAGKLVSQSILDKIKVNVPVFIAGDISSSMKGNWNGGEINVDGVTLYPFDLMSVAVTAFLMKNPLPELQSILTIFTSDCTVLTDYNYEKKSGMGKNSYMMSGSNKKQERVLVDKTKSFYENWQNIYKILSSYSFGSTNVESISVALKRWVDSEPEFKNERIEAILKYPVHLYISDGDFNGSGSPKNSIMKHQQNMKQWFGWDGVIVVWDVKAENKSDGKKFEGIPNLMYFGSNNISVLNQIFTNIDDLDIIDGYLPLKAMFETNRYNPVKELVDVKVKAKKSSDIELV